MYFCFCPLGQVENGERCSDVTDWIWMTQMRPVLSHLITVSWGCLTLFFRAVLATCGTAPLWSTVDGKLQPLWVEGWARMGQLLPGSQREIFLYWSGIVTNDLRKQWRQAFHYSNTFSNRQKLFSWTVIELTHTRIAVLYCKMRPS